MPFQGAEPALPSHGGDVEEAAVGDAGPVGMHGPGSVALNDRAALQTACSGHIWKLNVYGPL